jgi:hypothetical protein
MYNLLVTDNGDAWKRSPHNNLHRDRFLEHTESSIKDAFKELTPATVGILCSFPALFMYEEHRSQPGWRGRITAVRAEAGYLSISFGCGSSATTAKCLKSRALSRALRRAGGHLGHAGKA